MVTKLNIRCAWGGHLAGILLKNPSMASFNATTRKIIGIHGWLDNLNSLVPLAKRLVDNHPGKNLRISGKNKNKFYDVSVEYEIYLYDRAGHGFSSHLPRGSEYSHGFNLRDLRTVAHS